MTAVGTPADKIAIDPVIVTERMQNMFKRFVQKKKVNESFEQRASYDSEAVTPRGRGDDEVSFSSKGLGMMTPTYWLKRLRMQQIQKQIIDNA